MSRTTDPVGHWEDLEAWLSAMTDSLLPKAAETLRHQTRDQLDDSLTSIMKHDPCQSYCHKELAKISSSLSHTLIATLKLSDRHAANLQKELTRAQLRIKQLEMEVQERHEGSDETDASAKKEIARLQEALTTTTQEREQAQSAYAELASKLQYAEQLLEKAKTDFRDKTSRIKALETHLNEARTEIDHLTQQLDHITEPGNVKDELKHAYELRPETTRTRRDLTSPLPSRSGSPVPEWAREQKGKGAKLKPSPALSEETYLTIKPREISQASHRPSCGIDFRDLAKLARNINQFIPSMPDGQDIQAYLQDVDCHLEMRPSVTDKERLYLLRTTSSPEVRSFMDRQPVHTKTNYHLLRQALIEEFADSEHGLVAALETKQGHNEIP
ncbi:hypothetical protein QQF64_017000 [Cirrhinus molitorella]|uniref:Uncharacterized protein n=1 Tax=Cirrhinus molitorella TaxID=172907 RepID=A0ABR3LRY3_9TELE